MKKPDPTDFDATVPADINVCMLAIGLTAIVVFIAIGALIVIAAFFTLGAAWTAGAFVVTALAHLPLPADVI